MEVTYLGHSGFMVETQSAFYIFDYIRGELGEACLSGEKPVYFFVSHFHGDHYDPMIFKYRDMLKSPKYILSCDTIRKIKRSNKEYLADDITAAKVHGRFEFGEMVIETLNSTDAGVAYIVTDPEGVIYHAGDLNWWDWPGEDEKWNKQMEGSFKKEISLVDKEIDIAFLPLDPRQGDSYFKGMQWFLEHVPVREAYPMHVWDEPEVIDRYLSEHGVDKKKIETIIHKI